AERKRAEDRTKAYRRLWALTIALAVLAICTVLLAGYAWEQRKLAKRNEDEAVRQRQTAVGQRDKIDQQFGELIVSRLIKVTETRYRYNRDLSVLLLLKADDAVQARKQKRPPELDRAFEQFILPQPRVTIDTGPNPVTALAVNAERNLLAVA